MIEIETGGLPTHRHWALAFFHEDVPKWESQMQVGELGGRQHRSCSELPFGACSSYIDDGTDAFSMLPVSLACFFFFLDWPHLLDVHHRHFNPVELKPAIRQGT